MSEQPPNPNKKQNKAVEPSPERRVSESVENATDNTRDDVVQDTYTPEQDRSLTDAVLDAIETCKGDDLLRTDFGLYEDIDSDSLNTLIRHDTQPRTTVTFTTDGVQVELWGDGGVEIRVTERPVE